MAFVSAHLMAKSPQKMQPSTSLGEAFAAVVERLYSRNRREMAQGLELDQRTVENVRKGNAGASIITKGLLARRASHDDHWDAWLAIGRLVFGESLAEYQERKLNELIEKHNNAIRLHQADLARSRALDARTAKLVALDDRVAS